MCLRVVQLVNTSCVFEWCKWSILVQSGSATSATSGASAMSRQRARSATKWPILVHFSSAKNATSGASGQY